jgi:chaperonin GroES
VEVEKADEKINGIYIPQNAQEKPNIGIVLAAGPGSYANDGKLIPLSVKAGDRIMFGKYDGAKVKVDGKEVLIIAEAAIIGVLGSMP